jgi:hypothetical protein
MGWSSANSIFDPIAQALIDAKVSREVKFAALVPLIKGLRENDWDTEDESLEVFSEDPDTVAAFREAGVVSYGEREFSHYLHANTPCSDEESEKLAQSLYPVIMTHVEEFLQGTRKNS